MNNYDIHITSEFQLEKLKKGLHIFMFRATRIPPHLGIITQGKLYDISLKGPNIGIDIEDFYHTVLKRKTEVVFVELINSNDDIDLKEEITTQVRKYWKVSPDVSCLEPIKDFLSFVYQNKELKATSFIFELLPVLYHYNLIQSTSQLNLSGKLNSGVFRMKKYTKQDVENCINALNRKEQQVC